jgi:hypothetical protein
MLSVAIARMEGLIQMAIPIPPDFDYHKEELDINERITRDVFGLHVENWAKFRYAIAVGNDSSHLKGSLVPDVKDAYRELGKCHHEVVSSLGYCNYAQLEMTFGNTFVFQKAVKDFYFHGGSLLDNLSRLIYIINIRDAASAKTRKGEYVRHAMDRGRLLNDHSSDITAYLPHIDGNLIEEFVSTRNVIAHYWKIPIKDEQWPRDQLRQKAFAWPYDESQYHSYSGWQPIRFIIHEHFQELIKSQDMSFGQLLKDLTRFEANNGVTIA